MKLISNLAMCSVLCVIFAGMAYTMPFDTGFITWTQPNGTTTFTARLWGDEFIWWMETQSGFRIIESADHWYYYATLDANGDYASTSYKVGIDLPPSQPTQPLERSESYMNTINQQRAIFDSLITRNGQWYGQKQIAANGQPVEIRIGIILVEFADSSNKHYNPNISPRIGGYLKSDFEKEFFSSNNEWFDTTTANGTPHPENEMVFGSLRDYYYQMSLGKLIITGQVVNPTDANGIPQWITLDSARSYYHSFTRSSNDHIYSEGKNKAIANGWMTDTSYDKLMIIFSQYNALSGEDVPHAQIHSDTGRYLILSERHGLHGDYPDEPISFMHIGVSAHELGHLLGFLDEYKDESRLWYFDLMDYGAANGPLAKAECPASLSPYYRIKNGWVIPDDSSLTSDKNNFIVKYNYQSPKYYRINPYDRNIELDEHYIVETRLRHGFDLYVPNSPGNFSSQSGVLLIWHHNSVLGASVADRITLTTADHEPDDITFLADFFPKESSVNRQSFNDLSVPSAALGSPQYDIAFNVWVPRNERPAHFALNGIHRYHPSADTDYTIIDTVALKLTMASGTILSNTTWQYDVRVVGNVTVANDKILTIMPGDLPPFYVPT